MSEPQTRYEDQVPTRTYPELVDRARRAVTSSYHMLILCDDESGCEATAASLAGELSEFPAPGGRVTGPALLLDARGLSAGELCRAIYRTLAVQLHWPDMPAVSEFPDDPFDGFTVLSECSDWLQRTFAPDGRFRRPGATPVPTLIIWGVPRDVAIIFARWRDTIWALDPVPLVVLAPAADKDCYLLRYSDAFCFGGGIHRLAAG